MKRTLEPSAESGGTTIVYATPLGPRQVSCEPGGWPGGILISSVRLCCPGGCPGATIWLGCPDGGGSAPAAAAAEAAAAEVAAGRLT